MAKYLPFFLFIIFINVFIISGCKSENAQKTKIEFWTIALKPQFTEYINSVINKYENNNPQIEIEWLDLPYSVIMQKFMSSIAGGMPPDLVNLDANYAFILARRNALCSTSEYVNESVKNLYFEKLWNTVVVNDINYAMPWYASTQILIYNTSIFEKAGFKPGQYPQTWDEIADYAKIIKDKTGNYGYMPSNLPLPELFNVWQMFGVQIVDNECKQVLFNTPVAIERLEWYVNLYKNGYLPKETLIKGYQGAIDLYQSGKLGMFIAGPQFLLRIKQNAPDVFNLTDVAEIPKGTEKIVPAGVMNLVVPKASRHKKESYDFALFLTNAANQLEFCKLVPLLPTIKDAAESDIFEKLYSDPLIVKAINISLTQLPYAKDMSFGLKNRNELDRVMKDACEKAFYDKISAKDAIVKATEEWNKILNEE